MVRAQLEVILNEFGAMQPRPGEYTLAAGKSVTLHLAWGGTRLDIENVRAARLEEDVVFVETATHTMAAVIDSVIAVARK